MVSAAEANRKLSALLRQVKSGQSCVITSHGRPVARIEPVREKRDGRAKAVLLAHLRAQPIQDIGRWTRDESYDG
jgi:prevent-host-death family protein